MSRWTRRALLVGLLAVIALALLPVGGAAAQEGGPEPTAPALIVPADPGATTLPAGTGEGEAETPSTTAAPAAEGTTGADDGLAASTKVWLIIGGLVGVAFVVLVLTILYWRRTKPSRVAGRRAADPAGDGSAAADDAGPMPAEAMGPAAAAAPAAPAPVAASSQAVPPEPPPAQPAPARSESAPETPRPVGDGPPVDPRRSVFAPPPGDEPAPE